MTEIHIPYLPSAKFFKVLCRLGVHEQDISSDTDSNPQIRTIGGTVTIYASIGRFRYAEADGRSRVIYNKTETYNIQTSTGELFDVDGNLGVNLLDTTSPGIDPLGWTYKATVRPNGGEPFDVDIPASLEPGDTLDLGDSLVFTPSTGVTSLETRVKALEDAGPSSGGTTTWADITDKPSAFAPSAHRHDASEIDNLPSGSGGPTAWNDITDKPAVIAAGANAAAARDAIGAGTSNLAIGTTGTTAAAGNRQATTSAIGMVELATTAEATSGTDTQRAVTPAGLKAGLDTKAPVLGADDNYVTDAEKVKLSNLSGTNTGDQALPTWSTLSGKPAVIAAGATQADARSAIDFTEATQDVVGAMVTGAGGAYDDAAGTITLPSGGGSGGVDVGVPVPNGGTSHYYAPGWQFGNTWGTYSMAYQRWRFVPWWLDSTRTLAALGVNLSTAVTGAKMRIGVYNADAAWQPTTLVYQTAELDASASGLLEVTGLTLSMPAGRYVIGIQSTQNTGNLNLRCPTQAGFIHSSAGRAILGATYMEWKVNAVNGPFNDPATVKWDTADQGSAPCVFGRFQ